MFCVMGFEAGVVLVCLSLGIWFLLGGWWVVVGVLGFKCPDDKPCGGDYSQDNSVNKVFVVIAHEAQNPLSALRRASISF